MTPPPGGRRGLARVAAALVAAALLPALAAPPALAQPAPLTLRIGTAPPRQFTLAELELLPQAEVTYPPTAQESGHRSEPRRYSGVPLWTLLLQSGLEGMPARDRVRQVVTVTGQDGYVAVLALAEIDPAFEGKPVLVATAIDGAPIGPGADRGSSSGALRLVVPGALRLVVPGDRRGGRGVRDVLRIAVD